METIAITGTSGYSGRYVAAEAEKRRYRVIGLTAHPERENPRGYELRDFPWNGGTLDGVDILINTYWVRFNYKGKGGAFTHAEAVRNTLRLFEEAKRAGVERIVHTSITCPDAGSRLSYFRGKAELEQALAATGVPHSILRPAVLFGEKAEESILINNMAWSLRHLPCVGVFGRGDYGIQPIHVQDFAETALDEAERTDTHRLIQATGPETYTFRELWAMLGEGINCKRPVLSLPPRLAYMAAWLLGKWQGDVMLTWDEVLGLSEGRLAPKEPGVGRRSLKEWVLTHSDTLGRTYQSEIKRRRAGGRFSRLHAFGPPRRAGRGG